ncbi:hypothetical protein N781_03845 [Pontibacillus halophilus JSM 076056 = DSM 19796]|uniref:Uncharacterized protein n=1 Tax=Pontibacillus halophilus JSM 076056 = DSM 19796 TaxID=1385510 RepID=A0A0A5I775_9BACI|nr:hypothetical protein [Pontibacillus halophilus]KGX91687.1 hypothetical protein N781_03845 [Pontibacillus halophilus JSM 076056 = DSM 19796]
MLVHSVLAIASLIAFLCGTIPYESAYIISLFTWGWIGLIAMIKVSHSIYTAYMSMQPFRILWIDFSFISLFTTLACFQLYLHS